MIGVIAQRPQRQSNPKRAPVVVRIQGAIATADWTRRVGI